MRVVYVTSIPEAGPVTHLRTLVPAVAAAGAEARVVCATSRSRPRSVRPGSRHRRAPAPQGRRRRRARGSGRCSRGADVVHTHDRRAGLLVRPAAQARGAAVFHTYHGLPHQIGRARLDAPARRTSPARTPPGSLHGYLADGVGAGAARAGRRPVARGGRASSSRTAFPAGRAARRAERDRPAPPRAGARRTTRSSSAPAAILEHRKGVDVLLDACAAAGTPGAGGDLRRRPAARRARGAGAARSALDAHFHGASTTCATRLASSTSSSCRRATRTCRWRCSRRWRRPCPSSRRVSAASRSCRRRRVRAARGARRRRARWPARSTRSLDDPGRGAQQLGAPGARERVAIDEFERRWCACTSRRDGRSLYADA